MNRLKIGLNGFGRIGRAFTRIALDRDSFDIVAINTRKSTPDLMSYLLKHDSVYRTYWKEVNYNENSILVGNKEIITSNQDDPSLIEWGKYGVDIVVDATGAFSDRESLSKHIRDTVKKVILTAPEKDESIPMVVLGVNDNDFDFINSNIISNASCTTNCAAPMFRVIYENFGVKTGFLTTAHAYTSSQGLVDDKNKKRTRGRAAAINTVPTSTGAAKAVGKVLPELAGKMDGMALRVPIPVGSFTDTTIITNRETNREEVNQKFKEASEGIMKGILSYSEEELVSSDFIGSPYSCVFDSNYTEVLNGNFLKIYGWYDNEWGYSTRLVDLVEKLTNFIQQ